MFLELDYMESVLGFQPADGFRVSTQCDVLGFGISG